MIMHDSTTDTHDHSHIQNRHAVIPTAEKLDACRDFTGRGVTIAFLDSGFYPHPDIASRIVAFHDVSGAEASLDLIREPQGYHWHGTQTVVSCAGDGSLSDGIYRGLASESSLVLVKVSQNGRITDASIEAGLRWVIANRKKYDIRIVNMSLGGDADLPTVESCINRLSEELVAAGVIVTVAAGNSADACSIPPASSPSVMTVGGYSDENQFGSDGFGLYHSSFGPTADGLVKPEVIAPAMYVAAPILPGTSDYNLAELLSTLAIAPEYKFRQVLNENRNNALLDPQIFEAEVSLARSLIEGSLKQRKIVATHYQHVDGTSFAAPIVASVAAQMLEANPRLTPAVVKNLIISTATRLGGHPHVRQGFGIVSARMAVEKAMTEKHFMTSDHLFPPRIAGGKIIFSYHDDEAERVSLCGDFNGWSHDSLPLRRNNQGMWQTEIPCQPAGTYRYKFLVDGSRWTEDPSHGLKTDDGVGGFNSVLCIG